MIINFEEYNSNESIKNIAANIVMVAALLLSTFKNITRDTPARYNMEYFTNYAKSLNIASNDYIYKRALQEAIRKVNADPKISNKQEVIDTLNSLVVFYKRNDDFCNKLYNLANGTDTRYKTAAFVYNNQIMMLDKNEARPDVIYHELMHVVHDVSKINDDMTLFNFNNNLETQNKILQMITDSTCRLKYPYDINFINYLKTPTETYARLNQLKFYLFNNKFIKNPYDKLTPEIVRNLITGKIFASLGDKQKDDFVNHGFMPLLLFLDPRKIDKLQ